jgi:hypothetical protein
MSAAPPTTPKKPVAFGSTSAPEAPAADPATETGPAVAMIHILTAISSMLAMIEGMASVLPGAGRTPHFSAAVQSLAKARQALG